MFCTACGAKNDEGARFCTACGATLGAAPVAQAAVPPSADAAPVAPPPYGVPPPYDAPPPVYQPQADPPQYNEPPAPMYPPPAETPGYDAAPPPVYQPQAEPPQFNEPPAPMYPPPAETPLYDAPPPVYQPQATPPQFSEQAPYPPPAGAPYYPAPPYSPDPDGSKKKTKIWIPIVAGIVVLLLVFAALVQFTSLFGDDFLWKNSGEPEAEVKESETPEPEVTTPSPTPSPSPSPSPTSAPPSATPPPPPTIEALPAGGGEVRVNGETVFTFSPNNAGKWEFSTKENSDSDPYIEISDERDNLIGEDDDSAGNLNARLVVELEAGATYSVHVRFYSASESCVLAVAPGGPSTVTMPPGGGSVRVDGPTAFEFTPNQNGLWVISTFDREGDPILDLSNAYGLIASDDDTGGDSNALIVQYLNAGETYLIEAGLYDNGYGSFSLIVEPAGLGGYMTPYSGDMEVDGLTEFMFLPDKTGIWVFYTYDNGYDDPYLWLYDDYGYMLDYDDDGMDYGNAVVGGFMMEGETYYVRVGFYGTRTGSCLLTVTPPVEIPGNGGDVPIEDEALLLFTPDQTANWEFRTISTGENDPYIYVLDSNLDELGEDDDSAGGNDAIVTIRLEAGEQYYIFIGFWDYDDTSTTLRVTRR